VTTSINGQPAEWTPAIWALWHTHADDADPKYRVGDAHDANYFTSRPYVDQYNRGSREAGFTYTVGRRVYQVSWREA
jgi:hypothetical protein